MPVQDRSQRLLEQVVVEQLVVVGCGKERAGERYTRQKCEILLVHW